MLSINLTTLLSLFLPRFYFSNNNNLLCWDCSSNIINANSLVNFNYLFEEEIVIKTILLEEKPDKQTNNSSFILIKNDDDDEDDDEDDETT